MVEDAGRQLGVDGDALVEELVDDCQSFADGGRTQRDDLLLRGGAPDESVDVACARGLHDVVDCCAAFDEQVNDRFEAIEHGVRQGRAKSGRRVADGLWVCARVEEGRGHVALTVACCADERGFCGVRCVCHRAGGDEDSGEVARPVMIPRAMQAPECDVIEPDWIESHATSSASPKDRHARADAATSSPINTSANPT